MNVVVSATAYNRPAYLAESLKSWTKARGRDQTLLLVSVEPDQPETVRVAQTYADRVITNDERKGVLGNPWWAIERAFEAGADLAILAEDDVVVSNDVIHLMTWAAQTYADDPSVLLICGFSPWGCSLESDIDPMDGVCSTAAVHRGNLTSPTPWGILRERWPELRDSWDFDYSRGGFDHAIQKLRGERDVIRPCASRAQHIGREGGIHCLPSMFEGLLSHTFEREHPPGAFYEAPERFKAAGPVGSVNAV